MKLNSYVKGAYCKYCIKDKSHKKIVASLVRQNQIDIAEKRKQEHSFKKIYTKKYFS